MQIGKEKKKIIGLKCINWINTWIREDGVEAKKTKKLQEKAVKETIIEEKTSCEEDNTGASTIEEALDYAAKTLSDSQKYAGCILFDVQDRLQDMKDIKGEDYMMNYMKTHWGKIDLAKVLN